MGLRLESGASILLDVPLFLRIHADRKEHLFDVSIENVSGFSTYIYRPSCVPSRRYHYLVRRFFSIFYSFW